MGILSSLNYEQREATAILQIGTFLEYFDLMIYVHMAVILNELFFPTTDPHTASLISAMTFCATFVFRPFGALLLGYIGDVFGRKITVIITTLMMSFCCASMALLPTYAQIGITASWLIIICRVVQGISSMGEIMGAQIYLTESIKLPERYLVVTSLGCADLLGGLAALALATGVLALGIDWRFAFWVGALIAIVGTIARTALREAPDFINAKLLLKKNLEQANLDSGVILKKDPIVNQKVDQKTSLAYFVIQCLQPVRFYFLYIHCAGILKNSFHYTAQKIISHNLIIAAIEFLIIVGLTYLSGRIYPLKIINVRIILFSIFIIFVPFLLFNIVTAEHLLAIQICICLFTPTTTPAEAIFIAHFPVFKRFRYVSFLYAISRALMYVITSFGLLYLTKIFNHWGLLIVFIPIVIGCKWGVNHFEKIEKETGNYPQNSFLLNQNVKIG